MRTRTFGRFLVVSFVLVPAGFFGGWSAFELRVWAQSQSGPDNLTLGFQETYYVADNISGDILDSKTRVRTRTYQGGAIAMEWSRGDLKMKVVAERTESGNLRRTVVLSGPEYQTRKSTFGTQRSDPSTSREERRAEMRASLCGLRGEPTREILGFTAYRRFEKEPREVEGGAIYAEQWVAPALSCAVLQDRVWIAFDDGREVTIKTVDPLFRREGVEAGAAEVPADAIETPPSDLEESAIRRLVPDEVNPISVGGPFDRLDARYLEGQIYLD